MTARFTSLLLAFLIASPCAFADTLTPPHDLKVEEFKPPSGRELPVPVDGEGATKKRYVTSRTATPLPVSVAEEKLYKAGKYEEKGVPLSVFLIAQRIGKEKPDEILAFMKSINDLRGEKDADKRSKKVEALIQALGGKSKLQAIDLFRDEKGFNRFLMLARLTFGKPTEKDTFVSPEEGLAKDLLLTSLESSAPPPKKTTQSSAPPLKTAQGPGGASGPPSKGNKPDDKPKDPDQPIVPVPPMGQGPNVEPNLPPPAQEEEEKPPQVADAAQPDDADAKEKGQGSPKDDSPSGSPPGGGGAGQGGPEFKPPQSDLQRPKINAPVKIEPAAFAASPKDVDPHPELIEAPKRIRDEGDRWAAKRAQETKEDLESLAQFTNTLINKAAAVVQGLAAGIGKSIGNDLAVIPDPGREVAQGIQQAGDLGKLRIRSREQNSQLSSSGTLLERPRSQPGRANPLDRLEGLARQPSGNPSVSASALFANDNFR